MCWVAGLAASSLLASTCGGSSPTVPATPAVTVKTVSVTGLPGSLVVGQTAQLTATAGFSDNSTKTVSSEASWFSANTVVATVSSSGLVWEFVRTNILEPLGMDQSSYTLAPFAEGTFAHPYVNGKQWPQEFL